MVSLYYYKVPISYGGAHGVMLSIVGNGLGNTGLNPGRD